MVQPTLIIDEGLGAKPLQSKVMAKQIFRKIVTISTLFESNFVTF